MSRRKKHAAHENHERWLVSYADFITLLFAFFVVMFASSQADKGKAKQVSESVRQAIEEGQVATVLAGMLAGVTGQKPAAGAVAVKALVEGKAAAPAKAVDLGPSEKALSAELSVEVRGGKIQITMEPRGLVVSLREAAFFASGDDAVNPGTYGSIDKIASAILKIPNPVRLEGHTDAVPIHNSRFRSNWELSAARGIAVLELFAERFTVPRNRMAIVGYAETMPTDTNDTDDGRAHNRRVDVVILNQRGMAPEPKGR
ncbi:MAG TPA: flagellar motor protein MotB [Bryobacteraceae bacterium]|nr:flagellar motor protein MotB [Bryobacteraceae bacterium]